MWKSYPLDGPTIVFVLAIGLSTIFSSPNKIQALLNPHFGLISILSLTIFYFYLSRLNNLPSIIYHLSSKSSIILSVTTIFFFFQPFKNINLPISLQFLKNSAFSPLGSQLDLVIFLGFMLLPLLSVIRHPSFSKIHDLRSRIYHLSSIILPFLAFLVTLYSILKNNSVVLPPLSVSWYANLEILKNIQTAVFGVGVDNFSSVFTRVKDFSYNQTSLWQIPSFNVSANVPFHIFAVTGILGLLTFSFLIFKIFYLVFPYFFTKSGLNKFESDPKITWSHLISVLYIFLCLLFLPMSLPVLFLFFVIISIISNNVDNEQISGKKLELDEMPILYVGLTIISLVILGISIYFIGRSYAAEYYFKKSLNGLVTNDAKKVYDNMRQARILNPYEEKYVLSFSQVNFLIASQLAKKGKQTTEADKQTIAQAVQAAISEAKEAIRLNPGRAQYYDNLASIYSNIISMAQGADVWTISSYQRAIILDPSNPTYRLNLGGVYYLLGKYTEAINFFGQAVELKPNWPNAYYNLAWAYYQSKSFDKATNAMQNAIKFIDKKTSAADWDKANKDLMDFKNKLEIPQDMTNASSSGALNLPEKPVGELDPKLELPKDASPEAK